MTTIYSLCDAVRRLNSCCRYEDDETRVTRDEVMALDLPKKVWLVEFQPDDKPARLESISETRGEALNEASRNASNKRTPAGFRADLAQHGATRIVPADAVEPHATTRLIETTFELALDWPSAPWLNAKPYDILDNI